MAAALDMVAPADFVLNVRLADAERQVRFVRFRIGDPFSYDAVIVTALKQELCPTLGGRVLYL